MGFNFLTSTKACTKCGKKKPLEAFSNRRDLLDGYRNDCRICEKAQHHAYYLRHQEEIKARVGEYNREHKKEIADYGRQYRADRGEELLAKQRPELG